MERNNLLIVSIISLLLFILLLVNIDNIYIFDRQFNRYITTIQVPLFITLSEVIGYIFEPINIIIICLLISGIIFFLGRRKQALFFGITMLVSGILAYFFKYVVARTRPENALLVESFSSFPSGHALISAVLGGFIISFLISRIKHKTNKSILTILTVLAVLLIGATRIYLNVHWLSDVIGGFLLGLFVFSFSMLIKELVSLKQQ